MLNSVSERNQGAREDAAQVLTRAARPSFERRAEKEGGRERGTIRPPGKRLMNDFRRATTTQRRRRKGRRQPSRKCRADLVTRRGHRDSGTNGTETRLFFRAPFTSTPRNDATRAGGQRLHARHYYVVTPYEEATGTSSLRARERARTPQGRMTTRCRRLSLEILA